MTTTTTTAPRRMKAAAVTGARRSGYGEAPRKLGTPRLTAPTPAMEAAREVAAGIVLRGYRPSDTAVAHEMGVCQGRVKHLRVGYGRFAPWPVAPPGATPMPRTRPVVLPPSRRSKLREADAAGRVLIFPVGAVCAVKSDEAPAYRDGRWHAPEALFARDEAAERADQCRAMVRESRAIQRRWRKGGAA